MTRKRTHPKTPLRRRAEELLEKNPGATPFVSTSDAQAVIHELQVYQVELEMQNEELRRAQAELSESRDRYVELYEFAPIGYLTLDRQGVVIDANFSAAAMLGVERSSLLSGRKFGRFVVREAQDDWFLYFRRVLEGDEKSEVELGLRRRDGSPLIARLKSTALRRDIDEAPRCFTALIDITAERRAEEALHRAHDELEKHVEERTAELQQSLSLLHQVQQENVSALKQLESERATLLEQQQQLRALTAELASAEERERRELAAVLHDGIAQTLAVCRLNLDSPESGVAPNHSVRDAAGARKLLSSAIQQTRSLISELTSQVLYDLGLEEALEDLCSKMQEQHGIRFSVKRSRQPVLLDPDSRGFLYRAVRELLINVVKHARAHRARVTIKNNEGKLGITVADDGLGFATSRAGDTPSPSGGFGLFNLRHRLQHLGGRLDIRSSPGKGARVSLEFPIGGTQGNH